MLNPTSILKEVVLAATVSLVIAAAFTAPIFNNWENLGVEDWDEHFFFQAVPHRTLLEYKQMPLWNPYYCGGSVMLANPQSRFLSPSFLLILLWGPVLGIKIEIFLHFVIGLLGGYFLARSYHLDKLVAWLPAFVYMLSSMFVLPISGGMTWFLSVAYVPWAIFGYMKSFKQPRYIILSSICLVFMFLGGGPYAFTITLLCFILYTILNIPRYGIAKNVLLTGSILIWTICLGAIKFLPSYDFMNTYPRQLTEYSGYSVESLYDSLFDREQKLTTIKKYFDEKTYDQQGFWSGLSYFMDENGMYVGWIAGGLFLLGIGLHGMRHWQLVLLFLIFLWLGFGDRASPSLWQLLQQLPVYDTMRVAQRFRIIFMLCFALLAGMGLQTIKNFLLHKLPGVSAANGIAFIVILILLGDLFMVNRASFNEAFPIPPITGQRSDNQTTFIQISKYTNYDKNGFLKPNELHVTSSWSALYPVFLLNMGTIDYNCFTNPDIPKNAIPANNPKYKGEVFLHEAEGKVEISDWTPNRLKIAVNVSNAGYVVVNQNYYSGWHADDGRPIEKWNGLLAIKVSPEDKMIELYYRPASFVIGGIVSLLMVVLLVLCVFFRDKQPKILKKIFRKEEEPVEETGSV
ncbi:MAG: hypothetical protein HQM14_01235 [SAR324 cluster bacterium]|nr:hypothetical protein [SAR324 cluster bacterium]